VTVNGRTLEIPGDPVNYVIRPGESLSIAVDMTLSSRTSVKVTGLWMGITNGVLAPTRKGPVACPRSWSPILELP
jgi:hypothetical protein